MTTLIYHVAISFFLSVNAPTIPTTNVYICKGPYSKKYHYTEDCRGLNNCSTEIETVTLSDAKNKHKRTLCGWED